MREWVRRILEDYDASVCILEQTAENMNRQAQVIDTLSARGEQELAEALERAERSRAR